MVALFFQLAQSTWQKSHSPVEGKSNPNWPNSQSDHPTSEPKPNLTINRPPRRRTLSPPASSEIPTTRGAIFLLDGLDPSGRCGTRRTLSRGQREMPLSARGGVYRSHLPLGPCPSCNHNHLRYLRGSPCGRCLRVY